MSGPPDIALFFGRLHPLLVHLPIGLILLLAILEVLARWPRFQKANGNAGYILALAVPIAVFTVACGWLLSLGGGYQDRLLQWHKWTGIGTAAACALAGLCYWLDRKTLYRCCLFSTVAALLVASHFGGSLTHGSDYLARYAPGPLRALLGGARPTPVETKPKDINQMTAFAGVVQPVLQNDCTSCHGAEKSQAGLRLDSLTALLKGGKSGPAIVPGHAAESLLVKRLRLPVSDKLHMPPEGKPQLEHDDLALLQWWIALGAPADKKVGEAERPANIARILEARFGSPAKMAKAVAPRPAKEVLPLCDQLAGELNIALTPMSEDEPWVQCNASIAGKSFGDAEFERLAPIAANVRWLDLAGTKVSDAGLAQAAAMPNLTRLHLERTGIADAGLAHLKGLGELEYLNLYGTAVTDAGLAVLQDMPKLRRLYVWQTKVTPAGAKAFTAARTDEDQLQGWREEIAQLEAKIQDQKMTVDVGLSLTAAPATNAAPINAQCPVSGKPVDATKTVAYQDVVVAFCCNDCKAKFQQDPKPYLAKLGLNNKMPEPTEKKKL